MKSIKKLIALNLSFIILFTYSNIANAKTPQSAKQKKAAVKAFEQYIDNGKVVVEGEYSCSYDLNNPKVDYIYIDNDDIPECLISSDSMTFLLSFDKGRVHVDYAEIYIQEFGYMEKLGRFYMAFYPGNELSFMCFEYDKSKEIVCDERLVIGNIMCGEEFTAPTFSKIKGNNWDQLEVISLTEEEFKNTYNSKISNYVKIKTYMYDEYVKELESPLDIVLKF